MRFHDAPHLLLVLAVGVALAAMSLAPACSAPSSAQSDRYARGAGSDEPTPPEYKLGYQLQWQGFPRVTSRKGPKFFDVFGDTLVVHDHDHNVTVIETDTGRNRWAVRAGEPLELFVGNGRVDNRLVIATDTHVQIFDIKTGELLDRQRLAYLANSRPIIIDALAIFGCITGEVLAHNLAVGYKQWAYGTEGIINSDLAHLGGYDVAAVSQAGEVVILDAKRATARGRRQRIFDGVENDPVADERGVYVASRDQSIYAFGRTEGQRLWRYRTESPITAQPTIHEGVLYVHVPREGLIALDTRSGRRLWANTDVPAGRIVAMRDGRLLYWDGGAFTTIDQVRGESIDTIPFPEVEMLIFEPFVDGDLYTISRRGLAQKFAPTY